MLCFLSTFARSSSFLIRLIVICIDLYKDPGDQREEEMSATNQVNFNKCMKCKLPGTLMRTFTAPSGFCSCDHLFCHECFMIKNKNSNVSVFCPCCNLQFFKNATSKKEAALIGEGVLLCSQLVATLRSVTVEEYSVILSSIDILERALALNHSNVLSLMFIIRCYDKAAGYCVGNRNEAGVNDADVVEVYYAFLRKLHDHCIELFKVCFDKNKKSIIDNIDVYYHLIGHAFNVFSNYYHSVKYYELAYNYTLKINNNKASLMYKELITEAKANLHLQPKLRFKVGDEVEITNDSGEWQRGTVVKLYYREKCYSLDYNAPYRVAITEGSKVCHICAKEDVDRYVRKVGAKAIQETRYQSKLDAKVDELAYVYCSQDFIREVFTELQLDQDFCRCLRQIGKIKLSLAVLYTYRMLVMYSQPLVRTDSGYHIPTVSEVVGGFKEYLAPCVKADFKCKPLGCNTATVAEADYIVFQHLDHFFDEQSLSTAYGTYPLTRGRDELTRMTFFSYLDLYYSYNLSARDLGPAVDYIALIQNGFSLPLPAMFRSASATAGLTAVGSRAQFNPLMGALGEAADRAKDPEVC